MPWSEGVGEKGDRVKEEASGGGGAERSEFRSKYLKLSNPHFPHLYNGRITSTLGVYPAPRGQPSGIDSSG